MVFFPALKLKNTGTKRPAAAKYHNKSLMSYEFSTLGLALMTHLALIHMIPFFGLVGKS